MLAQEPLVHPLSLGEKRSLGGQQVVNSAARGEARAPVQLPPLQPLRQHRPPLPAMQPAMGISSVIAAESVPLAKSESSR